MAFEGDRPLHETKAMDGGRGRGRKYVMTFTGVVKGETSKTPKRGSVGAPAGAPKAIGGGPVKKKSRSTVVDSWQRR